MDGGKRMRVLVTGSRGFVGKNLCVALGERRRYEVSAFDRGDDPASLGAAVAGVDAVVHLAGVNRPRDPAEFESGNADLTRRLCEAIAAAGRPVALVVTSSIQAERDNPYGRSKRAAEQAAEELARRTGSPVAIYRLPGVFGKWCRPDYNSVVATFCHNIAHGLPIRIDDPAAHLRLVHVDDVVLEIERALAAPAPGLRRGAVAPEYETTLGELARQIEAFRNCRDSLVVERVGTGFVRALYATYVSYLPTSQFAYALPSHADPRGVFVEMLKTPDSGQFSFFTARPGVTRGGHYHHAKTEKFLVVRGSARFRFRHVLTGEQCEIDVSGDRPTVVETIPGWAHDITNTGTDEMVVMLWANEIFDRDRPDTIASPL
jgi:UDP-2-acetamido-2,6-beta-L-arabino-hexul-4-ose reductase